MFPGQPLLNPRKKSFFVPPRAIQNFITSTSIILRVTVTAHNCISKGKYNFYLFYRSIISIDLKENENRFELVVSERSRRRKTKIRWFDRKGEKIDFQSLHQTNSPHDTSQRRRFDRLDGTISLLSIRYRFELFILSRNSSG